MPSFDTMPYEVYMHGQSLEGIISYWEEGSKEETLELCSTPVEILYKQTALLK